MSITAEQGIEITSNVLKSVEWKGASAEEKEEHRKFSSCLGLFNCHKRSYKETLGIFSSAQIVSRVFKQVQTHNGKIQFKIVPFCEEV